MNLRTKIQFFFSIITVTLIGTVLLFVYTLFYNYRANEFQQEQIVKIQTTLKLLTEIQNIDHELIKSMDRITINELYNEKLLIFDWQKQLIYSSIDDTPILLKRLILEKLSPKDTLVGRKDKLYDVVGIYIEKDGKGFYGISKAYDVSGYMMLHYLKNVLILSFIGISLVLIVLLNYFSAKITRSILHVTRQIKNYNFEKIAEPIVTDNTKDEIALLVKRFNELMTKMNQSYLFQKHAVNHISHELKTPIAILVSNFEKIEKENDLDKIHELISMQKEDTKSLSDIINSLLEIAKVDSGKELLQTSIRIDELLFDIIEELTVINPNCNVSLDYTPSIEDEMKLIVKANQRLLKAAITNLLLNCSQYSADNIAKIVISVNENSLQLDFINKGAQLSVDEQQYLFQHFFRGGNSKGKRGFGLGLVFVHKILTLHKGQISYKVEGNNTNIFTMTLPIG